MNKITTFLAVCAAFLCMSATAQATSHVAQPSSAEARMLAKINGQRAAKGLPRLRFEGRLQSTARWMSRDMVANNRFSHTDARGRDPFRRLDAFRYTNRSWRGENLAAGSQDVTTTFQQWMNSPAHKANLLNPKFRYVGIALVCKSGTTYNCYWTNEFGGHWTLGFAH